MGKRNVVIVVLLIIGIGLLYYSLNKEKETEKVIHNYLLKSLKIEDISEIKIKNFTIKNMNGVWKIDNETCNKHEIEYLVNLLRSLDFNTVISTNKDSYLKFWVTDKQSLQVVIKTKNGEEFKLYIGKITPDGNGCYVRYKDKVYLISKNIKIDFNKTKKDFYLNKKVIKRNKK